MIRAGCEVAEAEDTRFHIHVAEGQYEGERTLARARRHADPLPRPARACWDRA